MVAFSQVKPNTIKLRALPVFPSRIDPGTGLTVATSGGVTSIAINFTDLERDDTLSAGELDSLYVAGWDAVDETFRLYLGANLIGPQGDPGPTSPSDYATRALAVAANIDGAVNHIRTSGYATSGDGGDALYKRGSGSTPGGFQSVDGAWWQIVLTGKVANVLAFGAVHNDATKYVENQTAFNNAFAACPNVLVTSGVVLYTQKIALPSTARLFQLDGALVAAGSISALDGLVEIEGVSQSCILRGSGSLTVTLASYPSIAAVKVFSSDNAVIDGITITGGQLGIQFGLLSGITIQNCRISGYGQRGIVAALASSKVSILGNTVTGGVAGSDHAISIETACDTLTISNNQVFNSRGWSYAIGHTSYFVVDGNISINSRFEGLVVGDSSIGIVSNNTLKFGTNHIELGISVERSTDLVITGNNIYQPHSSAIYLGIGVASGSVTGNNCTAPALRTVTGAANNGSGLIRLTLNSTSGMESGNYDFIFGVGGTTEANDIWIIDVIDSTHIDLRETLFGGTPSVFTHAYTSGGHVGDQNWAGVALLQGGGGFSITGNRFYDFNNTMQFLVKEFDASTDPNFISNNHGIAQNSTIFVQNANSYVSDDMGTTVAKLPSSIKGGSRMFVTDGLVGSNPLTGGSTGTFAVRINGAWRASP